MGIKIKEKQFEEKEEKQRKLKDYKLIKSYDIEIEKKEEIELELENDIYDEYTIGHFYNGKVKKIKTKKIKEKNKKIKLKTSIEKSGEYNLYGRNVNKLIIVEAILGIMLILSGLGYAYSNIPVVKDKVDEFFIDTFNVDKPTSPVISGGLDVWTKERIIKIEKDAKSSSGISYYEYCVKEDENFKECKWQKTETKNAIITGNGEYYVVFRGLSKKGNKGSISNTEKVLVDNEVPEIKEINIKEKTKKVTVEIKVEDKLSGINKIYYQIDEEELKLASQNFEIELVGEHKITIIIEDKAGNEIRVSKKVNASDIENEIQDENQIEEQEKQEEQIENNKNDSEQEEQTEDNKNDNEKEEIKVPVINLDKVPNKIKIKEEYELPSYYEFDKLGGEVLCTIETGEKVENTSEINVGSHKITCEAKGNNGYTTSVEKEIEVELEEVGNISWDGWMTLTLYYPENSTNWEYKVANENEVRTEEENWKDYTGPILVRLSQVDDVYIRYKINGETYIISPKGRIVVDIEPQSYTVGENQSTKVAITYESGANIKEYRIDKGEWQEYKKAFNVKANTLIEARAIKEEKVYDNEGNYQYTAKRQGTDTVYISLAQENNNPSGGNGGSAQNPGNSTGSSEIQVIGGGTTSYIKQAPTYLAGPTIINKKEEEIVEKTAIEITTEEVAEKIYYSIDYGKYQEYKEELEIDKNCLIRAYYIRAIDGKRSDTSYYYVQNIKQESYPYVRIDVTPSRYLSETVESATVQISARDYEILEYSYDGILYIPYESAIEVSESKTIYARAIDSNLNIAEAQTTITTKNAPKVMEEYDVSIYANPSAKEVEGLINKTEISIDYDTRATKKYYKIGYYGILREYTGPFILEENETIYAYATSEDGYGEATLGINYLTTGISAPKINLDTTEPTSSVKVTIEYAKNSDKMKYKIDNGEWIDYTEEITVYENCTIYAKNEDVLGNTNISSRRIKNIAYVPNYTLVDKGAYYIIHLNYPDSSKKDTREYKWTTNGTWKSYKEELGIILVKAEYKDIISKDGIKIEDENGNEVIYTDHYYLVNTVDDSLMDNLYMRWDTGKPEKPTFILSDTEPTKELEVVINYDKTSVVKKYKIVKPTGEDSGWLDYNGAIKVTEYGTIIYAKGQNSAEAWGEVANTKIVNIDDQKPEIIAKGDFTTPKQKVTIQLVGTDNLKIDKVGYVKGEKSCNKATFINNNATFTVSENGKYTICAVDKVGNIASDIIEITNIDLNAPDVEINVITKEYGTTLEFEIEYGDSKTREYKIGTEGTYKTYTGKITAKSVDLLNLVNEDGSITLYAKGIDEAGNETEVKEVTYVLDLDAPKAPVINASAGYPILTEYGVKFDDALTVEYDNRDDIINYISLDNGATWKVYTGTEHVQSGTVMAKSVKKVSGLTVSSTKKVTQPTDAIKPEWYDKDMITSSYVYETRKAFVSKELWNNEFILYGQAYSHYRLRYYDADDRLLSKYDIYTSYDGIHISTIPQNTSYLTFEEPSNHGKIKELEINTKPKLNEVKYYPLLTEYGFKMPYSEIELSYYQTAVKKLYRINEGEWQEYSGKIRLEINDVLEAKSVNKNNEETIILNHKIEYVSDAIKPEWYDKDMITSSYVYETRKAFVSKELWNNEFILYGQAYSHYRLRYYDADDRLLSKYDIYTSYDGIHISTIPQNTSYLTFEEPSNHGKIKELEINTKPKLNEVKYYPLLTEYGFKMPYSEIELSYYQTAVKKLYRINEGEWQEYSGKIRLEINDVLEAKSVNKNNEETIILNHKIEYVSDGIDLKWFDNDLSTKSYPEEVNRFDISSSLWNEEFVQKGDSYSNYIVSFYNVDNSLISKQTAYSQYSGVLNYKIPEKTAYIIYSKPSSSGKVSELSIESVPRYVENKYYATLTKDKVEKPYNEVELSYFQTAIKKLYRINDGEWQEYRGKIRLEINDVLEAKSIDRFNNESNLLNYKSILIEDSVSLDKIDGDVSTGSYETYNKYSRINISKELWGESLNYRYEIYENYITSFYDDNGIELKKVKDYSSSVNSDYTKYIIPENTAYILFTRTYDGYGKVYEINIYKTPKYTEYKYYPKLTIFGFETDYNEIEIKYFLNSVQKLYRINGGDWIPYTRKIRVEIGDLIEAKGIDDKGNETEIMKYNSTNIDDSMLRVYYDDDSSSSSYVRKQNKFIVDSKVWGSKLSITGSTRYNYAFKAYNENNILIDSKKIYPTESPFEYEIIENTAYIILDNKDSSANARVYDISLILKELELNTYSLRPNQSQEETPINPPKFAINNVSTSEKEISITYPQGYTNEYSVDGGQTWNLYTDIIKADKNMTIYARSIDESGKVVSSSSMKVTGIEEIEQINEQEENENEVINISEKILVGEDYPLPTEYKCYINDIEYTNTSTLEVGKYNVMCYKDEELIYTKEIEIVEENNET